MLSAQLDIAGSTAIDLAASRSALRWRGQRRSSTASRIGLHAHRRQRRRCDWPSDGAATAGLARAIRQRKRAQLLLSSPSPGAAVESPAARRGGLAATVTAARPHSTSHPPATPAPVLAAARALQTAAKRQQCRRRHCVCWGRRCCRARALVEAPLSKDCHTHLKNPTKGQYHQRIGVTADRQTDSSTPGSLDWLGVRRRAGNAGNEQGSPPPVTYESSTCQICFDHGVTCVPSPASFNSTLNLAGSPMRQPTHHLVTAPRSFYSLQPPRVATRRRGSRKAVV